MATSGPVFAVSAPGKVLFTGGFLVLDRAHTGLVLGLDARIHVHIDDHLPDTADVRLEGHNGIPVVVQSPQFRNARWLYDRCSYDVDHPQHVYQITNLTSGVWTTSSNKFVETTLRYVFAYLYGQKSRKTEDLSRVCKITIIADQSYYSQSETAKENADGFNDFGCTISEAHKTGLGSSAALVTSITAALLAFYLKPAGSCLPQKLVHNLAQAAHCAAQGKVGSGFDVAAATYGACLYRRFTPAILESIGDAGVDGFSQRLVSCVEDLNPEQKWDVEIKSDQVQVPKSLLLLMCDVDCGSETPGMVRQVLAWRKEKPVEAALLWNAIQNGSNELCENLTRLAQHDSIADKSVEELKVILETIRSLVREMSTKSGVPIEPGIITKLLDFCSSIPGVIGGVAPGAGGYDAVALLVRNDPAVMSELESKIRNWSGQEEETGIKIGNVRLLKARQAYEGVRYEEPGRYQAWT